MNYMMPFPKTIDEFIDSYKFVDRKEVYTNGSELIQVFRVQQALDHYLPRQKWISIKDRLPEKDGTVIICFRQNGTIHVTSAEWESWDGRFWNDRGRLISPTEAIDPTSPTYEITHWMPLPEPPETKQEDK